MNILVDEGVFSDGRFGLLADAMDWKRFEAIGRMMAIWVRCHKEKRPIMTALELAHTCECAAKDRVVQALVDAGLVTPCEQLLADAKHEVSKCLTVVQPELNRCWNEPGFFYVNGMSKRVKFLISQSNKGKRSQEIQADKRKQRLNSGSTESNHRPTYSSSSASAKGSDEPASRSGAEQGETANLTIGERAARSVLPVGWGGFKSVVESCGPTWRGQLADCAVSLLAWARVQCAITAGIDDPVHSDADPELLERLAKLIEIENGGTRGNVVATTMRLMSAQIGASLLFAHDGRPKFWQPSWDNLMMGKKYKSLMWPAECFDPSATPSAAHFRKLLLALSPMHHKDCAENTELDPAMCPGFVPNDGCVPTPKRDGIGKDAKIVLPLPSSPGGEAAIVSAAPQVAPQVPSRIAEFRSCLTQSPSPDLGDGEAPERNSGENNYSQNDQQVYPISAAGSPPQDDPYYEGGEPCGFDNEPY